MTKKHLKVVSKLSCASTKRNPGSTNSFWIQILAIVGREKHLWDGFFFFGDVSYTTASPWKNDPGEVRDSPDICPVVLAIKRPMHPSPKRGTEDQCFDHWCPKTWSIERKFNTVDGRNPANHLGYIYIYINPWKQMGLTTNLSRWSLDFSHQQCGLLMLRRRRKFLEAFRVGCTRIIGIPEPISPF